MKTVVLGMGVSGCAAAEFLKKKGRDLILLDRKVKEGILPDTTELPWEEVEQVIVSPGIPQGHPVLEEARRRGIEAIGEIELAFRHMKNRSIGITGTNGKTTTTLLVTHVLNSVGMRAKAVGNVGTSLLSALDDEEAILVIELSSFQLETVQTPRLMAAAILNLSPNHLDRHQTMEAYARAKGKIRDILIEGGKFWVGPGVPISGEGFRKRVETISTVDYIRRGVPERQTLDAAYTIVESFGVTEEEFTRAVQTFRKPPHRMEWVRSWHDIFFINDSKSTSIESVKHAISLLDMPIHLIAGGVHKGASYSSWGDAFQGRVRRIIAYGQAAPLMEEELAARLPFVRCERFDDAFREAVRGAQAGDVVLLSPGCSSYDQFDSYEHRGNRFKELTQAL